MSKLSKFFREYRQFGIVIISVLLALILELTGQHRAAHLILAVSALGNAIPLVWGMIQDLRVGTYGVDILAATAIISSVLLREYWAGMIIVLMLTGGEALEDYAEERAKTELSALLERAPKQAHLMRGRKIVDVKVSEIKTGDKIIIRPGETVPVDARIIEGTGSIDESSLTGESLPIAKNPGEELLSGSVNIDGLITAKALRTAEDSQYQQIVQLVRSAATHKSHFVRLADRYSIPFTLISFSIAIAAWALSGQSIRFLEVIVVATPCPLILGAPIALISGMSRAAKYGIIVKTGSSLEQLAATKTIAFDKTGTLTKGQLIVESVQAFGSFTQNEVLGLAAALEQNSTHVLARAIIDNAQKKKVKVIKTKGQKEVAGKGIEATVKGKHVLVGRLSFMEEQGVKMPTAFSKKRAQKTAAYIAVDGSLAGCINFKDEIRPEAQKTLATLHKLGIRHALMVTGDNKIAAQAVASNLGIDEIKAETLPADKLEIIEKLGNRPVTFVGDGVNDAPVLTAADVGIALGARGSTAASESADVVIMLDDLGRVATAVSIAKRTFYIAKQSIWIGIAISVGLMFIFSTGRFRPVYGAAIQEVVDVIVIFNALRAHGSLRQKTKPQQKLLVQA